MDRIKYFRDILVLAERVDVKKLLVVKVDGITRGKTSKANKDIRLSYGYQVVVCLYSVPKELGHCIEF